jgi:hypothetical protein
MRRLGLPLAVLLACGWGLTDRAAAAPKPLRVYILAGQSNMEGHAKVETFEYVGDDPATVPLLARMRGADGQPRVADHVWISLFTGGETQGEAFGKLTAGYGARRNPTEPEGKIGPEFTFGLAMDAATDEPVLLIKTAWGGKSLFYDFRPPTAGVYPRSADDVAKDRHPEEGSGRFYRLMIEHVRRVLADPKRVCPAYDPQAGYELDGFVWLQGWNDMVTRDVYPEHPTDGRPRYADYSRWLADLIRDVRKDLDAPRMPFVIGVMGVGGHAPNKHVAAFRKAMAAPADLPEFRGNVVAVETAPFWDEPLSAIADKHDQVRQMGYFLRTKHKDHANADGSMDEKRQRAFLADFEAKLISPEEAALWKRGASNAGYHYLGCAKTFALMGEAFATALAQPGVGKAVPLWDDRVPLPKAAELPQVRGVEFHVIKPKRPDADGCRWTLGVGLCWHEGRLYASYGFNKGDENTPTEEAHARVSDDGGRTWGPPIVMDAGEGDLGVSHGVFLSQGGKLWAFMGGFYGRFERTHTRAYLLDEASGRWEPRGVVVNDGFWPMQEPQRMADGNWVMAGFRAAKGYDVAGNLPAVAISRGDDFTRWDLVVIPVAPEHEKNLWGESTVIVEGTKITNIARYGAKAVALASRSDDAGRTWTPAWASNLPMATSKPYAGILSSGQRYLVCTTTADSGGRRSPLTIAVGEPGDDRFSKIFLIRGSVCDATSGVSDPKADFSYPYAVEHEGKLFIGYTHKSHAANELAIIPIDALGATEVDPRDRQEPRRRD